MRCVFARPKRRAGNRFVLRLACRAAVIGLATLVDGAQLSACEVSIQLEPPRAWVGEQVIHEIVIRGVDSRSTVEWLLPPAFPDARAVGLAHVPNAQGGPSDERRQRRAIFAAHAGALSFPAARLRCRPADGGPTRILETPLVTLEALDPPRLGRPESWRGLVGETHLALVATPTSSSVGRPIRLLARLSGAGQMRHATVSWPLEALAGDATQPELFPEPGEIVEMPGHRLVGRRTDVLDIVPRAAGQLWVPALEVTWWDPEHERYEVTRSEPIGIRIDEFANPLRSAQPEAGPDEVRDRRVRPDENRGPSGLLLAMACAGTVAVGIVWLRRRGGRS